MTGKFRSHRVCTLWGVLLVCFPQVVFAQTTTGTISGVVTDASGAVMPGVAVTVTHQETGISRDAVTDEVGRYRFDSLSVGPYKLSFVREGFETAGKTVRLTTASMVLDVTLGLKGLSTTVIVREIGGTVADIAGKTTASRMNVPDRELPVQVSSIPQQVLEAQGTNDRVTALRNASGVSAVRKWGMYDYYTIRGSRIGAYFGPECLAARGPYRSHGQTGHRGAGTALQESPATPFRSLRYLVPLR